MPAIVMAKIMTNRHDEIPKATPPTFARLISQCWLERTARPAATALLRELQDLPAAEMAGMTSVRP